MFRKGLLFFVIVLFSFDANAQKSNDIGLFLGGAYYMGEINRNVPFKEMSPALGLIYRRNYNKFYSAKYTFIGGILQASDMNFPTSKYQLLRNASFNSTVWDLAGQVEYNFLELNKNAKERRWSPFVNIGLALFISDNTPGIQLAIPFGVGIKYLMSPKFEIMADWSYRKTFTDDIDGISPFSLLGLYENRQFSQLNNNDWYSFVGISILYNFKGKKRCPAY